MATTCFIAVLCAITVALAAMSVPTQRAEEPLRTVATTPQRAKVPGYEREKFGRGWSTPPGAPCSVRELAIAHILIHDDNKANNNDDSSTPTPTTLCALEATASTASTASTQSTDTPYAGIDPYSGEVISPSPHHGAAIEIDHIIPLSAAWDLGAHSWDRATRIAFANDPLNVVAVSRSQNQSKSDQLPSEWLPAKRGARCWYANRMAAVAVVYSLPLPEQDVATMRRQCLPSIF